MAHIYGLQSVSSITLDDVEMLRVYSKNSKSAIELLQACLYDIGYWQTAILPPRPHGSCRDWSILLYANDMQYVFELYTFDDEF